jgi:hypothetical protein
MSDEFFYRFDDPRRMTVRRVDDDCVRARLINSAARSKKSPVAPIAAATLRRPSVSFAASG